MLIASPLTAAAILCALVLFTPAPRLLYRFCKRNGDVAGATAIEYGLIAALVSVAAIVSLQALTTKSDNAAEQPTAIEETVEQQ